MARHCIRPTCTDEGLVYVLQGPFTCNPCIAQGRFAAAVAHSSARAAEYTPLLHATMLQLKHMLSSPNTATR